MRKRKAKNVFEHLLLQRSRGGGWANQYGGTSTPEGVSATSGDWVPHAGAKTPTTAQPGSQEKIRELRRRLETGRELWHQEDVDVFAEVGLGSGTKRLESMLKGV